MNSDFQLAKENFDKGSKSFNDGLYLEAEEYFNLSLKYLPDRVSTLSSLLISKISLKKINECGEIISKINAIDPDYPYGIYAKALYHGLKLDFLKSKEELLSIINKKDLPKENLSTFYNCLGTNYVQLFNNKESIQCYLKAIDLNPENYEAHFNLGTRYLNENNFKEGWKHYEYRLKKNKLSHDKYPYKIDDIRNKKVLIRHEQGFGDTIQFSRLLNNLTEYTKEIDLLIPEPLQDLFNIKNVNIINKLDNNTNYDYEIYLMSLPYFLNLDLANPPKSSSINEELLKKNIKESKNLKIGLAWSGNENYNFDNLRSIKLSSLKKILDLKDLNNVTFYCLQKNIRKIDLNYFKKLNINYLGNLKFANLAKEIIKMDLVLACDTSILHLSSSLGVKTYGLFPFVADWRWADSHKKTNWYDTLEIFRLKKDQTWENLSKKIADKIKEIK
tara:strand:- start:34 stop:1368 length:1335 start_codon:yes stop_codon:yes gene_type:complete